MGDVGNGAVVNGVGGTGGGGTRVVGRGVGRVGGVLWVMKKNGN